MNISCTSGDSEGKMTTKPQNYWEDEYLAYTTRLEERKQNISQRIANISDPIQAITSVIQNEGNTLDAIWESDSGYPFDGVLVLIVMIPLALGVIGHYIALQWEPMTTGEELYDDFGNRIVEYPKMPIAYLQQTRKDLSAVRENRNSLAWLCHKWLISTNDVVQELQAPYPLEHSTTKTVPEKRGTAKRISKMYESLLQAASEWKLKQKQLKKTDLKRQLEARKRAKPLHTAPFKSVFRRAPVRDVEYLKKRIVRARVLWTKINQWLEEFQKRLVKQKEHPSDANDSYWTSSETFSSDSGEHWKSYKSAAQRWAREKKETAQYQLEKGKKMYEKAQAATAAAEAAKKKKEAEAAAAAAAAVAAAAAAEESKAKLTNASGTGKPLSSQASHHNLAVTTSKTKLSSKNVPTAGASGAVKKK